MTSPSKTDFKDMQPRAEEASRLLKLLGNAQRLRMLCLLVDREMSVGQLNALLPELSQSALSQHLAVLREEGVVATRRDGQTIWYRISDPAAVKVVATLAEIFCPPVEKTDARSDQDSATKPRR